MSAGQGFKNAGMSNRLNVVIIDISVAALCSFIIFRNSFPPGVGCTLLLLLIGEC